jgi:para-aminobenzoate synthetase component 1
MKTNICSSARPPVCLSDHFEFIRRPEIIAQINHFTVLNEPFLFAIDFNSEKGFVISLKDADNKGLQYNIAGVKNGAEIAGKSAFKFGFIPKEFESYTEAFEKVFFHLKRGDTYLLNLTFPTLLKTKCSLLEIYRISRAPYKLLVPGCFVVFSPELFVRICDGKITGNPMKGTIDATIPEAENKLLTDEKEFFEHNTIVDLIRNDLAMVATNVKVDRFRYIDRICTNRGDLLQMSSEISGELPEDYQHRLGEILFTLLPPGSVTGAPKEKTVEIIRAVESYERNFYTGIFGLFDGKTFTAAVSIRYIEQTDEGLVFKSGGGITALSQVESEYEEMLKKVYVPVI